MSNQLDFFSNKNETEQPAKTEKKPSTIESEVLDYLTSAQTQGEAQFAVDFCSWQDLDFENILRKSNFWHTGKLEFDSNIKKRCWSWLKVANYAFFDNGSFEHRILPETMPPIAEIHIGIDKFGKYATAAAFHNWISLYVQTCKTKNFRFAPETQKIKIGCNIYASILKNAISESEINELEVLSLETVRMLSEHFPKQLKTLNLNVGSLEALKAVQAVHGGDTIEYLHVNFPTKQIDRELAKEEKQYWLELQQAIFSGKFPNLCRLYVHHGKPEENFLECGAGWQKGVSLRTISHFNWL